MRKLILMTSAAVIAPISAIAQTPTCTATPDCASLGYTEASCPNGGVKCPWGDKWFCATSESEVCSKYGFKYTCTGTGYAGGIGSTCERKYTSCSCSSPYAWNGSACSCPSAYQYTCIGTGYLGGSGTACSGKYTSCECEEGKIWDNGECIKPAIFGQCNGYAKNCSLGDILFSNGTCSASTVSGKTPIAVVVYKSGKCGQAMALNTAGYAKWSTEYIYISSLPALTVDEAETDFASCENSDKIRAQGDNSTYLAVWQAYNYTTTGTKRGDWCLPAAGIFTSIYNNQSKINTGFSRAGGEQFTDDTLAWSSSQIKYDRAWASRFTEDSHLIGYLKDYSYAVRPVIEF